MHSNGEEDLRRMSIEILAQRCAEERERFFKREAADNRYCFELFRRAIVHRSEYAWEVIYHQYAPLVNGWVRRAGGFQVDTEEVEELVNQVFARFWQSVSPAKFERFNSLERLLQYLRLCAGSVVMDDLRRRKREGRLAVYEPFLHTGNHQSLEQQALERIECLDFWEDVCSRLTSEAEEKVIYGYFVLGLKPRQIQAVYPELFPSVELVYQVKRNVLNRLRRSDVLRKWLVE